MSLITTPLPSRPSLITLPAAAAHLGICKRTLERLISAGIFPRPLKIGRARRIDPADIDAYLERLRQERITSSGG